MLRWVRPNSAYQGNDSRQLLTDVPEECPQIDTDLLLSGLTFVSEIAVKLSRWSVVYGFCSRGTQQAEQPLVELRSLLRTAGWRIRQLWRLASCYLECTFA